MVAVAIAIAGPTWFGPTTDSLSQALLLTGVLCAVAAVGLRRLRASRQNETQDRPPPQSSQPSAAIGPTPWVLKALIALALIQVVWATVNSHFWDEHSCHYATASVIARGVFPPEHPLFPGAPFRYHFGYNVLAAHVRVLTRVPIDIALDVATLLSFGLLIATARDFGRSLAGRWGGGFMMLIVPLGGGTLAFLLFGDMGPLEMHWSALPSRWMSSTPPPVISNFFQHPQGLGMSFALSAITIFAPREGEASSTRRGRWALGAFVLGVGALVHVVFFAVLGLALGLMILTIAVTRRRFGFVLEGGLALFSALVIGYSLGGFFAPGPRLDQVLVWGTSFFTGSAGSIIAQHLVLFGLPLLLLPVAVAETIARPRSTRIALAAAALIGFVVPNVVTYSRSWDIVKFLGVGMFFANALLALRLAEWVKHGRLGGLAGALAVLLTTNTAWLWLARVSVLDGRYGVPKIHFPASSRAGHTVGLQLEPIIGPRDRVLTGDVELARTSGFLTPGFNWRRYGIGFMIDRERAERWFRARQTALRSLEPAALGTLGIRWLVLAEHEISRLDANGKARLADPTMYDEVTTVSDGGTRRFVVYRALPPAYGDPRTR